MTPDQIDRQMSMCERDYEYARKLGAPKVKALVRAYMKAHPGWTTNGKYDPDTYELGNRVMWIAQSLTRKRR